MADRKNVILGEIWGQLGWGQLGTKSGVVSKKITIFY